MSQKIPFLFALTLVGSFAGFPQKKLEPFKSSKDPRLQPNTPHVIGVDPELIGVINRFLKSFDKRQKAQERQLENFIFYRVKESNEDQTFKIEYFEDFLDIGIKELKIMILSHDKSTMRDFLCFLCRGMARKYPQEEADINHCIQTLDQKLQNIDYLKKKYLSQLDCINLQDKTKTNNEFLDEIKDALVNIYKYLPRQIYAISHALLHMMHILLRYQQNQGLIENKQSLIKKYNEYSDLEAQIGEEKELALKEWEAKKEHWVFSESYMLSEKIDIIKKYLMNSLLKENSAINLEFTVLKETVTALLPFIFNAEIALNIQQNLLQN